jgi:hypothetical protein
MASLGPLALDPTPKNPGDRSPGHWMSAKLLLVLMQALPHWLGWVFIITSQMVAPWRSQE